jgi:hypothetical protein
MNETIILHGNASNTEEDGRGKGEQAKSEDFVYRALGELETHEPIEHGYHDFLVEIRIEIAVGGRRDIGSPAELSQVTPYVD